MRRKLAAIMNEHANALDAARLDELAKVTKEYGRYSSSACGLAHTAVGFWLVGAFVAVTWYGLAGRVLVLWGPFLCAAALWLARRYYQRHGAVLEPTGALQRRTWFDVAIVAFGVGVTVASVAASVHDWAPNPHSAARAVLYMAVVSLVCAPSIADRVARGIADSACILLAVMAAFAGVLRSHAWLILAPLGALGAMLAVLGVVEHRAYLRVQARLRALRRESSGA